jgi:DNA-binding beta-propeller fold protein YncE
MRSVWTLFKLSFALTGSDDADPKVIGTVPTAFLRLTTTCHNAHENNGLSPNRGAQQEQDSPSKRTAQCTSHRSSLSRQAHQIQRSRKCTNNGKPPEGVPPFGANGVEFNNAGDAMFVCNTAMDWIVKIPTTGGKHGTPGTPEVFTNSLNGCDGLRLDSSDNIWVAANQADEIVVVDPTGKVIAKLGDFNGVKNGVTDGLLFPASPAFSPDGKTLYVTNLELDLRTIGITQSVDSQWAAEVKQHSIAKLAASIPSIP